MVPSHEQVRTAFDFLLSRGYTFVAEHVVAMAGTIVFRRPHIWLNVEWDRSEPWITFTFTGVGPEPVMWTEVDRALMGHTHPAYGPDNPTAPLSTLVAFLHTCLPSLEARIDAKDPVVLQAAGQLESAKRRELEPCVPPDGSADHASRRVLPNER